VFFKGSRYEDVPEHEIEDLRGRVVRYKGIREIPPTPARLGHEVWGGERLDHIAHRYYRDPERFWRICDSNLALRPDELVAEVGRVIHVPPSRKEPKR
jgi:hypothetical protein